MATKVNLMKFLQEMKGFSEFGKRHPAPPRRSPLYLFQLRSHVAEASGRRRRLEIATDPKDYLTLPNPVKISFATPTAAEEIPIVLK
jgi:hypothetical protein